MAYSNRFVMSVIIDGQVCKELANGTVPIPFGCEYKLRFRNKHNRRAVVKFTIDGENISGGGYVIPANSHIDIERHQANPVKFKFVSLDSPDAVEFGKNGPNKDKVKGLIEAEFSLEREVPVYTLTSYTTTTSYTGSPMKRYGVKDGTKGRLKSFMPRNRSVENDALSESTTTNYYSADINVINTDALCHTMGLNDSVTMDWCATATPNIDFTNVSSENLQDGATVEGSHSNQCFASTHINTEPNSTTVKLFLQGFESEMLIDDPVLSSVTHATSSRMGTIFNPASPTSGQFQPKSKLSMLKNETDELQAELERLKQEKLKREIEKLKLEVEE